ncbi:MAG: hypothetical protein IIV92_04755 [Schwartzia sp.]|nr:hypothetical protein [Schwartzia sp. (in: firmicutes)]
MKKELLKHLVVIRGGGDISTGIAITLWRVGYHVLLLEQARPTSLRREASFADCVYSGEKTVERVTCRCAASFAEARELLKTQGIAMLVDPIGRVIHKLKGCILVDAVNDGAVRENKWPLSFSIGLGEGFCAGQDVDCVVELVRSFEMGKVIKEGRTQKLEQRNAQPSETDCIMMSPVEGVFAAKRTIGAIIKTGDPVGEVIDDKSVVYIITSPCDGILRGLIHDGNRVAQGQDIAEVDMRVTPRQCARVADRARAVAGGVLEAVLRFEGGRWN